MSSRLQVGIAGTGVIAKVFANACEFLDTVEVTAVASRTKESAVSFQQAFDVKESFADYDMMLQSPSVELVYVAVPHSLHYEYCRKALMANKHVLCEKPLCIKAEQAQELFDLAQQRKLMLFEGMWSKLLPNTARAKEWIDSGCIGKVSFIDSGFCFEMNPQSPKRLTEPGLAGGSLFDVGVYSIEMSNYYAGEAPIEWHGIRTDYVPGVDASTAMVLRYENGVLATLRSSIVCSTPSNMTIWGSKGRIELADFYAGNKARLILNSGYTQEYELDCYSPLGFTWQIREVQRCIEQGRTFSSIHTPEDTVASVHIMESVMHAFYPELY